MINLKKVSRTFSLPSGDIDAVKNVSLKIKNGEFIGFNSENELFKLIEKDIS